MSGSRQRLLGWLAVAAQFAALAGLILAPPSVASPPPWLGWLGAAVMAFGAAIMLLSFVHLGPALTPTPVPNKAGGLRDQGLYSRIRHPIYSGLLTLALGMVLRSPGWWPLFWWVVLAAILTTKAFWEERMLTTVYPDYADYRRRTGRFLPRLRRG